MLVGGDNEPMLAAIHMYLMIKGEPFTLELRTSRDLTCLLKSNDKQWAFAPKRLNPWQLRVGDVDGNGKLDFLLGVYKRTHLIPHPHRTLFIYEFDGEEVLPKWKASTIGRPLVDFAADKFKSGNRVITVEKDLEDFQVLSVWRWRGFGLVKVEELARGKSVRLEKQPWPYQTVVAKIDGKTLKWSR